MLRVLIGSLVAAAATMLLGWVFFGSPMMTQGYRSAPAAIELQVLEELDTLPETGTYVLPSGVSPEAQAQAQQGVALVQVNKEGIGQIMSPKVFLQGFIHMAVSFLLMGLFLLMLRGALPTFLSRVFPVLMLAAIAVVWTRLGQPIWFHTDWRNALYLAVTDFLSLAIGGFIVSAFLPRPTRR